MYYIILIILLVGLVLLSYKLFNKDCLSPSFIVSLTYLISTITAYLAKLFKMWNYIDIKITTTIVIFVGVLSFIIGEYIIRKIIIKFQRKRIKNGNIKKKDKQQIIHISNFKLIIIYIFLIITFVVIYIQMTQITGISNNIPKMINEYRNLTPLFNNTSESISINTFAMQLYRISIVFAYIFMFILINNKLLKDRFKRNIKYVFIIIIPMIISLFIAGRTDFIKIVVAGIFMTIIRYRTIYSKYIKVKFLIKIIIISMLIIIPLFYLIMPLIGRTQQTDIINYITFYLGSPIPSLDEIISRGEVGNSQHFGEETFKGIQGILNRFGLIDYYKPYQRQWIGFNGLSSNIFTGLKTYYSDFGIAGVIICQILFATIVTSMYIKAKRNSKFYIIFFVFFCSYMIIDQFRLEKLFASFLTLDTIIYIVYIMIIFTFLFKNKNDLLNYIKRGKSFINGTRKIIRKN